MSTVNFENVSESKESLNRDDEVAGDYRDKELKRDYEVQQNDESNEFDDEWQEGDEDSKDEVVEKRRRRRRRSDRKVSISIQDYADARGYEGESVEGDMYYYQSTTDDTLPPKVFKEQRRSVSELDSYASLKEVIRDVETDTVDEQMDEEKNKGIPGVARLDLSPLTQKIVGCVIDENVTTEYPWIYVRKEVIADNLDLHSDSSDFLPVKDEIEAYPEQRILVGYAPSHDYKGQFYVCVSEEGRKEIARRIEAQRIEQQERVKYAVRKTPGVWSSLGSGQDIEDMTLKNSRPLFEIEVESTVNQLKDPIILTDRPCVNQRDGYVEIDPSREIFDNVMRVRVDKSAEAVSVIRENEAQTPMAMLVNSISHCFLEEHIREVTLTKNEIKSVEDFVKTKTDEMIEKVWTNTTWDLYADDYAKLAADVGDNVTKDVMGSMKEVYVEIQSYYNGKLSKGRVINDLSWHPQWTGLVAVAYTTTSKTENLVGPKPRQNKNNDDCVLVWSFDDCLKPKIMLESNRQVTSVSFCPYNGNIIIGGCCNGQIVIWDISGKIEQVESAVIRTAAQVKHETVVKSLSTWMKELRSSSIVIPTAISSLQHSPKGAITKIEWLPTYNKLDNRGKFHKIEEGEDSSLQFVTSSEDGSLAFWDLNWRPPEEKKKVEKSRKKKVIEKPKNLVESISPYNVLDNVFKPFYILIVQHINETRNAKVTAMSLRKPKLHKVQIEPTPHTKDITARRFYEIYPEKPDNDEPSLPVIFIGTAKGACGIVSWEGFDFSTGVTLNKEVCKWTWRKQHIHDGPVTHAVRSMFLEDVMLTVGGHVFAVWRDDYEEPILWRKSHFRYTSCCWDNETPSKIIVGRNDGTIEAWDIFIKSHMPTTKQSLSGRIITGIYAHKLPLNPQCVGFCDYNGALRIFLTPQVSFDFRNNNLRWMRQFIDREVHRLKEFNEWQRKWVEMNAEQTEEERQQEEEALEAAKIEEKLKIETAQKAAKIEAAKRAKAKARKALVEQMRARWVKRELERMERTILVQKGLREEELARRLEPVERMKREACQKEAKRRDILERADELFVEEVSSNFPKHKQKFLTAMTLPSARDREDFVSVEDDASGDYKTEEDEIIQDYEQIETKALSNMSRESYELSFSWRRFMNKGLKRRRSMDVNFKFHKIKAEEDKAASEEGQRIDNDDAILDFITDSSSANEREQISTMNQ